jgi:hypothetical protein
MKIRPPILKLFHLYRRPELSSRSAGVQTQEEKSNCYDFLIMLILTSMDVVRQYTKCMYKWNVTGNLPKSSLSESGNRTKTKFEH